MKDSVKLIDWIIAAIVGAAAAVALAVFSVPGLDPSLWKDAAIFRGLLPPETFFPGVWRLLPGVMTPLGGAVGGGVLAFLLCISVRTAFVIVARPSEKMEVWRKWYAPLLSAAVALLAIAADPVWRSCQVLTPTLVYLVAYAVIVFLFLNWLRYCRDGFLYAIMLLSGVLASESAYVFLMLPVFVVVLRLIWRDIMNGVYKPVGDMPDFSQLPKWRMFLCFVLGFAACAYANIETFVAAGGVEAAGWSSSDILVRYGVALVKSLINAASPVGWVIVILIGLAPLFGSLAVLSGKASDEEPMPFAFGFAALLCGIVAAFQVMPVPMAWFWQWNHQMIVVHDPTLLSFACVFSALTVVVAFSAFVIENFGRANMFEKGTRLLLLTWALVAVGGILLFTLTGLARPGISAMQRLVDDAVRETVREMEGLTWIFTDGSCDAALELEAARQGRNIRPINMMSTSSGRDIYLRLRDLTDEADVAAAKQGAPVMLRVWAGEKPDAIDRAAVQLGFEFWKRANKPLPEASGLLARTKWPDAAALERGRKAADDLSKRILEIAGRRDVEGASPALKKAFADVSWRLSRMARNRDKAELADKLDAVNSALRRMLEAVEYERIRTFMQLTPKEGLQLALKRADFVEARRFASAVLKADENDPEGNFGIGMSYLLENRLKEAEFYLSRCLKARPHEPAVLNNLAIIYRKMQRYEEALKLAREAKRLLPENKEIKTTLKETEEAYQEHLQKKKGK